MTDAQIMRGIAARIRDTHPAEALKLTDAAVRVERQARVLDEMVAEAMEDYRLTREAIQSGAVVVAFPEQWRN
jgi:hypothetical protein